MKTAVILTARKERDSEVPYPLIPFDGDDCLIDRNLEILRANGFKKIILVCGFRADLFQKYASEDVILVVNSDYEFTSSMGSLALANNFIKEDFLLVEGDTFFEKIVVEKLSAVEQGNCISVTEESGSGDECYVESKNGYVTNISKDRHRVHNIEGEMIGVTRISLSTYRRLLDVWSTCTNPYVNYEYLLMDVTDALDRPCIYFRNLIFGDVDTMDDFLRLRNLTFRMLCRKENPFDIDNLRHHLAQIFQGEDVSDACIVQIGGMSNKNFLIEHQGKKYVLRVPGRGSEGMVERDNEEFNAFEACKMGVNPPIRYFDSATGLKLADFVEDAETLNFATIQRHDNMEKIAKIYHRIHNSTVRLKNEFNIFREIDKYDELLRQDSVAMYEGWEQIRPRVMKLETYLNQLGVSLHPCHNDAIAENFIKSKDGTIFLIDWEYSGMNDPMADFAALFLESNFTESNQRFVLTRYFEGTVPPNTSEKILCYQVLWDCLWAQWTIIKENKGDDFGTYGQNRFNRAILNLEKLKKTYGYE